MGYSYGASSRITPLAEKCKCQGDCARVAQHLVHKVDCRLHRVLV
jgi:hypothetical protein